MYCCHWWFSQVSSSAGSFSSPSAFSYCLSSTSALANARPACDASVTVIARYGPALICAASRAPIRLVSRCRRAPHAWSSLSVDNASSPAAIRPSHASAIAGSISVASTEPRPRQPTDRCRAAPSPDRTACARPRCVVAGHRRNLSSLVCKSGFGHQGHRLRRHITVFGSEELHFDVDGPSADRSPRPSPARSG